MHALHCPTLHGCTALRTLHAYAARIHRKGLAVCMYCMHAHVAHAHVHAHAHAHAHVWEPRPRVRKGLAVDDDVLAFVVDVHVAGIYLLINLEPQAARRL